MRRTVIIPLLVLLQALPVAALAGEPSGRIFTYRQAKQARELARRECKPLVVHFVPETSVGREQLDAFYARPDGVPPEVLEQVVIVVVPTERFARFARQLGVVEVGGYRTISAYDLSFVDDASRPTCRSGFV